MKQLALIFIILGFSSLALARAEEVMPSAADVYTAMNKELYVAFAKIEKTGSPAARRLLQQNKIVLDLAAVPTLDRRFQALKEADMGLKPYTWLLTPAAVGDLVKEKHIYQSVLFRRYPQMIRPMAQAASAEYATKGKWERGNDFCYRNDAYRHMRWTAFMSKYFGRDMALIMATSREMVKKPDGSFRIPDDNRAKMDIINNAIGIELGHKYRSLSDAELTAKIDALLDAGGAVMLDPNDVYTHVSERKIVPTISNAAMKTTLTGAHKLACDDTEQELEGKIGRKPDRGEFVIKRGALK